MAPVIGSGRYLKGGELGKGTFGTVYKALDQHTGRTVAIKKIRMGEYKEGVNVTALREIKLLKELRHRHVIELIDVFPHKANLSLVFEFMETDLEAVIRDQNIILSQADIKSYMLMTLKGLAYCHSKWVLHRDMKPNNLLIGGNGELKLGDFGLARIFGSPDRTFTHQVFARWYRAPELLFGSRQYGAGVDMWALGCIFAELLLRKPFLPGSSDIDQLGKIFAALGTPQEEDWPGMTSLPDYVEYVYSPTPPLRDLIPSASEDALALLQTMLTFDPNRRITAQLALSHRYFTTGPPPTAPADLPRPRKAGVQKDDFARPIRSPTGPLVLSPASKIRRLSVPSPATGEHGQFDNMQRRDQAAHKTPRGIRMAPLGSGPGGSNGKESASGDVTAPGVRMDDMGGALRDVSTRGAFDTGSRDDSMGGGGFGETPIDYKFPMSVDTELPPSTIIGPRPTLNSSDRKYLRKRKLDMDVELHNASQELIP